MTNQKQAAISALSHAILAFEEALNATLAHMGQSPVELGVLYACANDGVARLSFDTALQPYEFERFVKVAMGHVAANTSLSDRVRELDAGLDRDYIFFQF